MSLAVILDALGEQLGDAITYRIGGAEAVARMETPPRIVASVTGESISGPKGGSGRSITTRAILTRRARVTLHAWGANLAATEALVHALWRAIHIIAPGAYQPGEAVWGYDGIAGRGLVWIGAVDFLIPITRSETVAEVVAMNVTGDFVEEVNDE